MMRMKLYALLRSHTNPPSASLEAGGCPGTAQLFLQLHLPRSAPLWRQHPGSAPQTVQDAQCVGESSLPDLRFLSKVQPRRYACPLQSTQH
ncbi:hypothetical protein NDU88_005657 [Pleurodeles waltl]|uniref:Uncharacterized protein n=1 Tax=Pleurodeles waltl TaxID=8319 RepID=A0AAV7LLX1_PLEWA|nr:hypothetical protein NDU88_005657 [Pleurodeles waltl]